MSDPNGVSRPLILLVDDQPSNLHVLVEALHHQYDVQIATTGEAALLLAQATPQPALILLDVMMPGVDGYEVCRRLKSAAQTRHIPVIFVTARTDAESERLGFELGAVDYITKPFNIPVLRARVRTHLTLQGLLDELELVNHRLNEHLVELMQAHDELRQSRAQQELYARVFECTAEGILITDADGRILAVNPAFTRITGYSAVDALGNNPRILKSGHHPDAFYRELWTTLREKNHWSGEIVNRRKNGEIYPELRTISAVRDGDGHVTHYVAVFNDISTVKRVQERLDHLTWHDPLTGLANRYLFSDHLQQTLSLCTRRNTWAAALLVDIDRFKLVNEARGLNVADQILDALASRLRTQLREGDTLARLAADDFAVILPELGSEREATAVTAMTHAEAMRAAIAEPLSIGGSTLHLTASIGIALFPAHPGDTPDEVLRRAETARRRGAVDGGNRARFFDDDMTHEVRRRFDLEQELYRAVERGQLALHFQPQVDDAGRTVGAEALLRWQHPRRGLVSPTEFIPLAEESDLICKVEAWTLANVGPLISRMRGNGPMRIALNISPRHFRSTGFVDEVIETVTRNGLAAGSLVLELTEATTKGNIDEIADKMRSLAEHGVSFAIDDFGVGYSSLSYLRRLPIAELKIDGCFMRDAPDDSDDAAIVDTILAVARQLRLRVVAEGVASQAHAAFLDKRAPVCRQGFFYGRPEPASSWLNRVAALHA